MSLRKSSWCGQGFAWPIDITACVRELAREQDETSDEEKAREKEREQRVTERNGKPDTTTDKERTILIGRMHGWERMLVGGERDRV